MAVYLRELGTLRMRDAGIVCYAWVDEGYGVTVTMEIHYYQTFGLLLFSGNSRLMS